MKKLLLILVIISATPLSSICQSNIWYFGDKSGIKFNGTGTPSALTNSKMIAGEGSAVVTNADGDLLFYTDGSSIWNSNHNVDVSGLKGHQSSTQTALVIPVPETNCTRYFVFTVGGVEDFSLGANVSLVEISGNPKTTGTKIKSIEGPTRMYSNGCVEKLNGTKDGNGGYWVVNHEWKSDKYHSYHVTKNTTDITKLLATNVVTSIGKSQTGILTNGQGQLKFSRDGKKMAIAVAEDKFVEIYDFNLSDGKISNVQLIQNNDPNFTSFTKIFSGSANLYGLEFSNNDKYLYVGEFFTGGSASVFQFDMSSGNLGTIRSSVVNLATTSHSSRYPYGAFQMGPDGKIWIAHTNRKYLGVINKPDLGGTSCDLQDNGVTLSNDCLNGLPTTIIVDMCCVAKKPFIGRDTSICKNEKIVLKDTVKNVSTYLWSTKETSSTITISDSGLYWLEIGSSQCKNRDSIHVKYKSGKAPSLGKDTFICEGVEMLLDAKQNATQYLWSTSEKTKTIRVSQPGKYWLQIIDNGCTMSDTININLHNMPKPNLGKDTIACEGKSIDLIGFTPNSKSYTWNNNSTNITETVSKSGTYILTITDYKCTLSDTIQVSFIPYPLVNLGKDTGFCGNINLTLDAGNPGLNKIWNTNATTQTIPAVLHGIYWVQVNNRGCITRDSILIKKLPGPNVDLGKDTAFCVSFTKTLDAKNPGMNYLWNDASTNQTLVINSAGKYWVQVSDNSGCIMSDTFVFSDSSFTFRFGNDTTLCFGELLNLKTISGNYSYLWQSGDQTDSFLVNSKGTYKVKISNGVCQISDSILIDFLPPIDFKLQNDTSLCEGEDVNLIVQGPNGFKEYLWQPGNISTQDLLIKKEGKYFLKVTDLNDCSAIDSITIEQNCPLLMWVPTIFSPAGNYDNSKFGVVYKGPPIIDFEMLIYNRWGELIFKSHNVNTFWDGTYMEKPCQLGMYLCIINLKAGYKKEVSKANYKGMFYLNR